MPARVLVLFDSRGGFTEHLAEAIADGVRSVNGVEVSYRRIDEAQPIVDARLPVR